EHVALAPESEPVGLANRQVGAHGEGGFGQVQGVAVAHGILRREGGNTKAPRVELVGAKACAFAVPPNFAAASPRKPWPPASVRSRRRSPDDGGRPSAPTAADVRSADR